MGALGGGVDEPVRDVSDHLVRNGREALAGECGRIVYVQDTEIVPLRPGPSLRAVEGLKVVESVVEGDGGGGLGFARQEPPGLPPGVCEGQGRVMPETYPLPLPAT